MGCIEDIESVNHRGIESLKDTRCSLCDQYFHSTMIQSLQQIRSGALLSADRTAKLGDRKSRIERLGKSPACREPPLTRAANITSLHLAYVAGDLDGNSLARECLAQICLRRIAVAIKPDQRFKQSQRVEGLRSAASPINTLFNSRIYQAPCDPQAISTIRVQRTRRLGAVKIEPVAARNHAKLREIQMCITAT